MIIAGLLTAIYAYGIFFLGLAGILYKPAILIFTFLFILCAIFYFRKKKNVLQIRIQRFSRVELCLLALLLFQTAVTLIGVLGPELGFDALWYHLTLPKIYLQNHSISHISGGLLYYSDMPTLTELLYAAGLTFGDERIPKFIHFLFGVGTCIILYRFSSNYLSKVLSLLTVLLFSSNLVVGWEAASAYIDLSRTFFELASFILLITWIESKKKSYFYLAALFLGLAVAVKLLSLTSLPIVIMLILYTSRRSGEPIKKAVKEVFAFSFITLFVPSPWFVASYFATGSPIYPFLTHLYPLGNEYHGLSLFSFLYDTWQVLTSSSDPISPLYLIALPLILIGLLKIKNLVFRVTLLYSVLAFSIWYFLPRVGGGRFLMPYLPVFSFLTIYALSRLRELKVYRLAVTSVFVIIIIYAFFFVGYRFAANAKYIPYILERETKAQFLSEHLNFSYGDFYDTDGFFRETIKQNDKVLLIGFHNLYYVDFPFVDQSYVKKGERFNFVAVQNAELPERFNNWNLVYSNVLTHVKVYSTGGMKWVY